MAGVLNTVLQPILTWISMRFWSWLFPLIAFILTQLVPGDPALSALGPVTSADPEAVAAYLAKYATKATESYGAALDRRIHHEHELDYLRVPAHIARRWDRFGVSSEMKQVFELLLTQRRRMADGDPIPFTCAHQFPGGFGQSDLVFGEDLVSTLEEDRDKLAAAKHDALMMLLPTFDGPHLIWTHWKEGAAALSRRTSSTRRRRPRSARSPPPRSSGLPACKPSSPASQA